MKSIDSKFIKEIRYDDADSLLKAINYGGELYSSLSGDFIFRGHYSEEYSLLPSALRDGALDAFEPKRDYDDACVLLAAKLEIAQIWGEYQLLQRYYDLCDRNHLKVPGCARLRDSVIKKYDLVSLFQKEDWLPRDLWEVAALAQHYGVPTRLLDWTSNIKTALYFASVDHINSLSIYKRLEKQKGLLLNRGKFGLECCEIWALDTKVVVAKEGSLPLAIIRPPYKGNPNLAAQEGVFTLWQISKPIRKKEKGVKLEKTRIDQTPLDALISKKLEELKAADRPYMYRISFPQKACVELYAYLEREGHTAAKLFPGYSGVVQSLKESKKFRDIKDE